MSLSSGDKLGSYEIVSSIGKGGMGEVWRARDPQLGRDVAIKVSAQQFTDRFEREARAIAALNHANVCTLYSIGPNYLVMEYIEGPTLAERMREGPIPLEEALSIAKQIADALEAAHEKSIVHRDLKPANVKIRPDGSVKVLDFGLAKAGDAQEVTADSPTIVPGTQMGMILGTAGYMSPEQARGKDADKRADIWAFGVVLYEMVTGNRLFDGATVSDSIAAILKEEPNLTLAPEKTRRLLARCLEKDPKKRLRDIGDWQLLLDEQVAVHAASAASRPAWIAAGVLTALLAALAFVHFREKPPETRVVRSTILPPEKNNFFFDYPISGAPALSPDGRRLVFAARPEGGVSRLWVRALDSATAQPLADTEKGAFPFWSPDSRFIGFGADGKLKKIAISGGPSVTLADAPGFRGGSWGSQGVILFAPNPAGPLQKVAESGGTATVATVLDTARKEFSHRWPWFLPDGRHFLFASVVRASRKATIYQGSIDSPRESRIVAQTNTNAVYASGYMLYLRDTTLVAQPFDLKRLATAGEAVPIAERVAGIGDSEFGFFTVSNEATLLFQSSGQGALTLAVLDRSGRQLANAGDADEDSGFSVSPDGKRAILSLLDRSTHNSNLWIYDFARNLRSRFSFGAASEIKAVRSPDGSEIIFNSNSRGHMDLYRKPANGAGTEELLFADNVDKYPTGASPDGKFVMYSSNGGPTDPKAHLWALPLQGERKPFPFSPSAFNENDGTFSHDGKWVAYDSDESGRFEIYIAPFPGTGGKRQVSAEGGFGPLWRADAKELFFVDLFDNRLMAAEIDMHGSYLEVGAVRPLFGGLSNINVTPYDIFADGQRFLVPMPKEQAAPVPLTLVQNWIAGLGK